MSIETHPLTFIDPVCSRAAFHIVGFPVAGTVMASKDVRHIDNRPVMPYEVACCDSCGRPFRFAGDDGRHLMTTDNYVPRGIEAA